LKTNTFPRKRLEYNNERCFLRSPCRDVINKGQVSKLVSCGRVVRESVKRRLVGAVSNEVSAEAEEPLLLEAVTREQLQKTAD
jgi:hypothetical protein